MFPWCTVQRAFWFDMQTLSFENLLSIRVVVFQLNSSSSLSNQTKKKTNVKQQKPATEQQLHRRRRTTSSKLITINQQYKFHNFIQLKNSTINTLSHIRNTIGIKVFRFRNGLEAFDKTIRIEDISLLPASRAKGSQEWARFRVIFGV